MNKYIVYTVAFAALLLSFLTVGSGTSYAANTVLTDDFSSTSGNWDIIGINNTPSITKSGAMQLTSSGQGQVGTIWLKDALAQSIKPPYTVTFRFLISGVDRSDVGADGIVFMFNKKQNTSPVTGSGMGFQTGNGYGIEFDTFSNPFDPSVDHISLFKNNPDHSILRSNLLAQVNDTTFENAKWHDVKINVDTNNVKVYLDKNLKLNWNGTLDPTYSGIGLTASTGYYYNTQTIDDLVITKPANVTGVNSTLANGVYPAGTIIPIQLTFNDTIQVTGAPILALNTGRNATYASGSGTNTLTFNYNVQAGDNLSSLNYTSNAGLSLNGGTLYDSLGNAANLSLENAVNSLEESKLITLDTTLPTVTASITSGNPDTNTVTLNLSTAADVNGSGLWQMRFSNDNEIWSKWEAFAVSKVYSVPDSTNVKKIYIQVKDKANNISNSSVITINPPVVAVPGSPFNPIEDTVFTGQLNITNPDNRTNWQLIMTSSPNKGTVTLGTALVGNQPKVTFIYTPYANVNGTDSFSFKLSDGVSYSNVAKVDLSITAVNDPPVAINRTLSVVEDVPITFSVTATDIDSPSLTFSKAGDGSKGKVALLSPNGLFSYTPDPNANGIDTFQFTVSDGLLTSNGTVSVTIQPVNDAPVVQNLTISTKEDVPVSGTLTAFDADGDTPTFKLVSNGTHGNVTINPGGTYTYTPNMNINGTNADSFTFIASDALLNSNIANVTVDITPVNDAPSFNKGFDQKVISASVAQNVYGWATAISSGPTDESGQIVNFSVTNNNNSLFAVQPTVSPNGTLSYTPNDNVTGSATITLTLHDNGGTLNVGDADTSSAQQFVITISNVYVTITGISVSPPDVWVKDHVTVTSNVYSSIGAVDIKKWAIGIHVASDFVSSGTAFTDSFPAYANDIYTIYAAKGSYFDVKQITITQIDNIPPVLVLRGDPLITIEAGTPFVDPGANVTDNSMPPNSIIISAIPPVVNSDVVGDYTMTYSYTDQAGNQAASITRTVRVRDTTAPVITLLGASPLTVAANTEISTLELRASIKDNSVVTLTSSYSGVLNLSQPGRYDLIYNAIDSFNNSASVTRTVYVTDITAPTITVVPPVGWTADKTTISVTFDGTGSAIISKQWAAGEQALNYFASADPAIIHPILNGSFDVTANNSYTIFAEDQYGNKALSVIPVSNIDKTAPSGSILINNGVLFTASNQATLQISAIDTQSAVDKMIISNDLNDPNFSNNIGWISYADTIKWTLPSGDGSKTVYIKFMDHVGNVSNISSANIVLDSIGHPELSQLSLIDQSLSLSPGFDPAITHYSVTVQSSVLSIDLFPKAINNLNTISVISGGVYQNGILHSNELSNLSNNGNNPITIRITTVSSAVYKDYTINVYKLSSRNNITGFKVNGLAADPVINITNHTVSLSVYSQTNLIGLVPQITLSRGATIKFAPGSTNDFTKPVRYLVKAEDGLVPQAEWTVTVDSVITTSNDLSNLSLEGFPFAFDPATTSYTVDVGPLFDQVTLTAVTADPSATVAITIADIKYNGLSRKIALTNGNNLVHVLVTTQSGSKSYDINIHRLSSNYNPILAYASSNADGTEVILSFKAALNLSTLTPDKFSIQIGDSSHVIVTSVSYDQGSLDHSFVHLKLTGTPPEINNWKLNITGVKTASGADVNVKAFLMTSTGKVQQIKTLINPLNDGVHMDNIIKYMQTQQDVTGDNIFDSFDIHYLLEQI